MRFKQVSFEFDDEDYMLEVTVGENNLPHTVTVARLFAEPGAGRLVDFGIAVRNRWDKANLDKGAKVAVARAINTMPTRFREYFWKNHRQQLLDAKWIRTEE